MHCLKKVSPQFRPARTDNTVPLIVSAPAAKPAPVSPPLPSTSQLVFHPTWPQNPLQQAPTPHLPEKQTSRRAGSSPAPPPSLHFRPLDFPVAAKQHPPPPMQKRPRAQIPPAPDPEPS